MLSYNQQTLPFEKNALLGISENTLNIHYDKLYAGYVNKTKEIEEKLIDVDINTANQVFSNLRALKAEESFARNGVILHESYFKCLGGNGSIADNLEIIKQIISDFGSFEDFKNKLIATGMSIRGWAILAWDSNDNKLHIYGCDSHNNGGIWGAFPILTLDVYEHAYMMDFGSDRKKYIETFFENIDWERVNEMFREVTR